MDAETTLEILNSAERASIGAITLHGLLLHEGLPHHARLALAIHEEAAISAATMGSVLGVEVQVK